MKPAHSRFVARRRYAKECVSSLCEPAIKDLSQLGQWPDREYGRQPTPAGQHTNHFNPAEVTFRPPAIRAAHMHLRCHLLMCEWRRAPQHSRIVVVQPLEPLISIERFNLRTRPAAEIAVAVSEDFDASRSVHRKNDNPTRCRMSGDRCRGLWMAESQRLTAHSFSR